MPNEFNLNLDSIEVKTLAQTIRAMTQACFEQVKAHLYSQVSNITDLPAEVRKDLETGIWKALDLFIERHIQQPGDLANLLTYEGAITPTEKLEVPPLSELDVQQILLDVQAILKENTQNNNGQ